MSTTDFDSLRLAYKQATDAWVATIRAEEALATPDHSMVAWEKMGCRSLYRARRTDQSE